MTIYTKAMDRTKRMVLFLGLALTINGATAGTILNPSSGGTWQIDAHSPIGQSFTAEDSFVKASLFYQVINSHMPYSSITLSLYSGNGAVGTALASDTFSLAANYSGFFDSDFSSVALTVNSTYSIVASIPGNSPYWGVAGGGSYAGGDAIQFGTSVSGFDYAFRITPTVAAPVPEPETYAMLLAGLGLLGFVARRRKLAATA